MRTASPPRPRAAHPDQALIDSLRAGDESEFLQFVARHQPTMLRVARSYVSCDAVAQEVVQETWEAMLRGLDRFEGRSRLKTWVFRILINGAKTRGSAERRMIPFSAIEAADGGGPEDDRRFDAELGEYWIQPPRPWQDAERRLMSLEVRERLRAALDRLPPSQRLVVALRDVEGLPADEVCSLMGISDGNQRVLLHRGRTALRRHLDDLVGD